MARKKRKFDSHSITRRLYLLFGIVMFLFLALIARLGYMQVVNQDFYTDKLAKASKTKITTSSVRGQIYDATGKPLVENTTKQVVTYTRDNRLTAGEIRATAQKLLTYVSVSDTEVTDRQEVDYYLADKSCPRTRNLIQMAIACPSPKSIRRQLKALTLNSWAIQMRKRRPSFSLVR